MGRKRKCQFSLVQQFATRLMAVCMRYTHRSGAGQRCASGNLINAFKYIQSYSGKGSFEGWLRRIAVNCSLKVIKTMYEVHTLEEAAIDANSFAEVPTFTAPWQKKTSCCSKQAAAQPVCDLQPQRHRRLSPPMKLQPCST